jgi:predicted AlkP superfamily pyrophosphatase or phosphodiesterase
MMSYFIIKFYSFYTQDIFLTNTRRYNFRGQVDELVNWITKFKIDMSFLYLSQPDSTGHGFGPDSTQYAEKISEVDSVVGYLMSQLGNLTQTTNVIILSDHGMANAAGKPILVTSYVTASLIDFNRSIFSYVSNVYAADKSQVNTMVAKISPNYKTLKIVYKKGNFASGKSHQDTKRDSLHEEQHAEGIFLHP